MMFLMQAFITPLRHPLAPFLILGNYSLYALMMSLWVWPLGFESPAWGINPFDQDRIMIS